MLARVDGGAIDPRRGAPVASRGVQHIELDASVLAFTVAVSIVTGVLFGLVPMLSVSTPSLVTPLKRRRVR